MKDMDPADIVGEAVEHVLTYTGGNTRRVYVTPIETPYPHGKLIVSRTDTRGIMTQCNPSFVEMSGYGLLGNKPVKSASPVAGGVDQVVGHLLLGYQKRYGRTLRIIILLGYIQNVRADHIGNVTQNFCQTIRIVLPVNICDIFSLFSLTLCIAHIVDVEAKCFCEVVKAV